MPPRTPLPPHRRLPLLVTADGDLLDELLRLAAAGGTEVEVAADPAAARPRWLPAPLVLVGTDQAPGLPAGPAAAPVPDGAGRARRRSSTPAGRSPS